MSDTILPWICPYLIGVAQQYGVSPHDAPLTSKGKKVQLVKFLTYGEESQDAHIWARVSDKNHIIPIRFSKEAIQGYYKSNQTSFTRLKSAIISIKDFRPIFRRVPLGGKGGMSAERTLTIDCHKFQYIGSAGEDVFGSPVTVEKNLDILEWSNGLNKDGGAGNVLRDRKREEEAVFNKAQQVEANVIRAPQIGKKIVTVKPPVREQAPTMDSANTATTYEKSWVAIRKPQYRRPPAQIAALLKVMPVVGDPEPENKHSKIVANTRLNGIIAKHALDLGTSPASTTSSQCREPSTSPGTMVSGWHPSPAQPDPGTQSTNLISSQFSPPTPAQRTKGNDERLPPSSPPPTSQLAINETRLQTSILRPTVSPPTHARRSVTRKVPRPPQPMARLSPTGSARILIPNSDTSLSHGQSQSQSESQSQQAYLSQPQLSQYDVAPDRVVHKEHKTGKDLQNGNSQVYTEDIGNKADDEVNDNHSDYDSTHDSLFSGHYSDSENSSYDGDHSSLEPLRFREDVSSKVSTTAARERRPSQGQDSQMSANYIPTSMIVHPPSSQRQDDESHNIAHLEANEDAMSCQVLNRQSTDPIDTIADKEHGAESQIPDEDDDEIHDDIPKPSVSAQSQISRIAVPLPAALERISAEEFPATRTQVQPPRKSHSPTISETVSKTPRTSDETVGMGDIKPAIRKPHTSVSSDVERRKNVVTHDAKAWLVPSFLRPSSSINIDGPLATPSRSATSSKDHSIALAKRKTPGGTSENTAFNSRTSKQQAPSRGDQNSAPLTRAASLPNPRHNKSYHNSIKAEASFVRELSHSRPQKRARNSEHVSQTSSDHAHKKRKINYSEPVKGQPLSAGEISSEQKTNTKLLGGWSHGLDQPVLFSTFGDPCAPSEEDVVTWDRLKGICLRTGRERERGSL